MKTALSFIFSFLFIFPLLSQEKNKDTILKYTMHKPPVFQGCGGYGKELKRVCFTEKLNQHIRDHFQYPKIAIDSGYQGKVIVKFKINEKGLVENVTAKGPYLFFEKEAIRIISKLPKMKPAKNKKGDPLKLQFSTSLTFRLEDENR